MKNFRCNCGQTLFFENTSCLNCNNQVGFDPESMEMYSDDALMAEPSRQFCKNSSDYNVCNWFVTDEDSAYCMSCSLNHTIPNLLRPERRRWWKSLEHAKRRLIYSLLSLGLPLKGKKEDPLGMAFSFIEDKRSNPQVFEDHVNTGHFDGHITVNIAEADQVTLEKARAFSGELYRTLLGHLRHESGHYYFSKLINTDEKLAQFRELFGDESKDYDQALKDYYANKGKTAKDPAMVSHYAQSHPWEDWAEVWSHYLHMVDTLDTAAAFDQQLGAGHLDDIEETLQKWSQLTIMLNSLNRSMGLEDAYPFVLSDQAFTKLRFVHGLIYPS
ncbi:MAG: hypothetical protein HOF74_13165 [Gammaproteobacteria bacterium]|jgi:hypothetical protein|nr:hypothetical protein [Gammaproteobacteria bacterium]MBT3860775.1 hypothetical protein [Gammaproteobacteria bacterium]MBT3986970.1 hypothetical protein [Gammaproteobacteria bacterium]MBT4257089.1 hypothetical protein [Gammaproteobacteria bacterium]MBT4582049.1 hypothetical protein [Gammaproteobacteria bacterium]